MGETWVDYDYAEEKEREDLLRDKIAVEMVKIYANHLKLTWTSYDDYAEYAYGIADAMIKRRRRINERSTEEDLLESR